MIEDFPSNPYAPPEAPLERDPYAAEELRPVPFEDREAEPAFWRRVGGMFKLVFTEPMLFFQRIPVTRGLEAPVRFLFLMLVPAFALMALVFGLMGMATLFGPGGKGAPEPWIFPVMGVVMLLVYPLLIVAFAALWGAFNHACLWMWRGTGQSQGVGQSVRATLYAYAFMVLVSFVPLVGALGMLAGVVFLGMGLARIHRTETWRGVMAVLSPVLLCCGCYLAFFLAAIGMPALFK